MIKTLKSYTIDADLLKRIGVSDRGIRLISGINSSVRLVSTLPKELGPIDSALLYIYLVAMDKRRRITSSDRGAETLLCNHCLTARSGGKKAGIMVDIGAFIATCDSCGGADIINVKGLKCM